MIHGKNESFIHELVKKEKEIHASSAIAISSYKSYETTTLGKCLFKMQKALNLYNRIFWEKETIST